MPSNKTLKILQSMQLGMRNKNDLLLYLDSLKQMVVEDYGSLKNLRVNSREEKALSDVMAYSHKADFVLTTLFKNCPPDDLKKLFGSTFTTRTNRRTGVIEHGVYLGATYNGIKNIDKIKQYIIDKKFTDKEIENAIKNSNQYINAYKDKNSRENERALNKSEKLSMEIVRQNQVLNFIDDSNLNNTYYSSTNELYARYDIIKTSTNQNTLEKKTIALKVLHEISKANKNKGFFNKLFHPSLERAEKQHIRDLKQELANMGVSQEEIEKAANPDIEFKNEEYKAELDKSYKRPKNFNFDKAHDSHRSKESWEISERENMINESDEELEAENEEEKVPVFKTEEELDQFSEEAYNNLDNKTQDKFFGDVEQEKDEEVNQLSNEDPTLEK